MPFVNKQEWFGPLILQFERAVGPYMDALAPDERECVRKAIVALQSVKVELRCAYLGNGLWQVLLCNQLALISLHGDGRSARIGNLHAAFSP